jgi:hypothetical protein
MRTPQRFSRRRHAALMNAAAGEARVTAITAGAHGDARRASRSPRSVNNR